MPYDPCLVQQAVEVARITLWGVMVITMLVITMLVITVVPLVVAALAYFLIPHHIGSHSE